MPLPVETFPALRELPEVRHGFTGRVPDLDVKMDRESALALLDQHHATARRDLGLAEQRLIIGKQVHGAEVAMVDGTTSNVPVPGVDGLITASSELCLGVYVADCCAVYLVEPERRVIALLHSGRKGSELGITGVAIEKMVSEYGCNPRRMVVQLSPCIRPPHYEVDFAAMIIAQCHAAGVGRVEDCGTSTAAHVDRYYSYRMEMGKTGRMLALLALVD